MDWLLRYADPTIDWNYAMVTLVVRFIGVFVVMALVQVALQVAAVVIKRLEERSAMTAPQAEPVLTSLDVSSMAAHEAEMDGAVVAAIALALDADAQKLFAAGRGAVAASAGRASAWAMAGRLRSLR